MAVCPICSCGKWSIVVYKPIPGGSNKPTQELIGKLGENTETETLSVFLYFDDLPNTERE